MDPWGTPRMTGRGYLTMIICRDHVHYFSLRYFTCPADNRSIPTQKQFTLSPQSDHSLIVFDIISLNV